MRYFPAKQIVPGIWIGSQGNALDAQFIRRHNIRMIVNCTTEVDAPFKNRIPTYRIPMDDAERSNPELLEHAEYVAAAMDVVRARGGSILVHCYAGVSRSASMTACYLMLVMGLSKDEAIRLIRAKKPETFQPRVVFDAALTAIHHTRYKYM
jgi:dual specificity MAP kinase phosphatase